MDYPRPMVGQPAAQPLFRCCALPLFRNRTTWLLAIYAAVILLFFSLSTNQEYYTFPAYFPLAAAHGR